MSTRKSTVFYGLLLALVSVVAGMVLASRLDLAPASFGSMNVPAANSAPISGTLDATTFRNIAQEAGPTVVSIVTTSTRRQRSIADLFGLDEQNPRRRGEPDEAIPVQGAGSGFIIDKDGYILTNNHVIADASEIEVKLSTMGDLEQGLPADVVGRDELTDTALIKVRELPRSGLIASKFGDSDQIAPGDWVMAVGNPFRLSNTVTVGVVSAVGRLQGTQFSGRFEKMIQTDAAINRGNSGGPLLNIRGEVVGINTMILSDQSGGNMGIGFSVPINTVRDILPQLRSGKVVRGVIGVSVLRRPMTEAYARDLGLPGPGGAEIATVVEGGAADRAGLEVGDVVVEFNGEKVADNDALVGMVVRTRPGTTVPVKIYRNGKPATLNVTVAELDLQAEQGTIARRQEAERPERVVPSTTAFGMELSELTARDARQLGYTGGAGGAVVTRVVPGGPAALAGIEQGDVIMRVGATETKTLDAASQALDAVGSGRVVRLIVWRDGGPVLIQIRKR
jgi:serine protease Do